MVTISLSVLTEELTVLQFFRVLASHSYIDPLPLLHVLESRIFQFSKFMIPTFIFFKIYIMIFQGIEWHDQSALLIHNLQRFSLLSIIQYL